MAQDKRPHKRSHWRVVASDLSHGATLWILDIVVGGDIAREAGYMYEAAELQRLVGNGPSINVRTITRLYQGTGSADWISETAHSQSDTALVTVRAEQSALQFKLPAAWPQGTEMEQSDVESEERSLCQEQHVYCVHRCRPHQRLRLWDVENSPEKSTRV